MDKVLAIGKALACLRIWKVNVAGTLEMTLEKGL